MKGEIRAIGFNEAIDKFYEYLEIGRVYYVSKCTLKAANKKFSSIKCDYEMQIEKNTEISLVFFILFYLFYFILFYFISYFLNL